MSEAKKAYEDVVSAVCGDQSRLCLHAQDLHSVHLKALQAALAVFDPTRIKVPHESDTDRKMLIEVMHYIESTNNMALPDCVILPSGVPIVKTSNMHRYC